MNNACDKVTNVIKVSFPLSGGSERISTEHPESKRFSEEIPGDPLEDLLSEFSDIEDEDLLIDNEQEDFIFNHQKAWDFELSYKQSAVEMADVVGKQVKRLKEDMSRIKYYLDELNLDDR